MKFLTLILVLLSFTASAADRVLNCSGNLIEFSGVLDTQTLKLKNVKLFSYGEGEVSQGVEAEAYLLRKTTKFLNFTLPTPGDEATSLDFIIQRKNLILEGYAEFKASLYIQPDCGEREKASSLNCSFDP